MIAKDLWASKTFWIAVITACLGTLIAAQDYLNGHPGPWTAQTWLGLAVVGLAALAAYLRTQPAPPIKGTASERQAQADRATQLESLLGAMAPRTLGQRGGAGPFPPADAP